MVILSWVAIIIKSIIILGAVILSIAFKNGKWMWLILLVLLIDNIIIVSDSTANICTEENKMQQIIEKNGTKYILKTAKYDGSNALAELQNIKNNKDVIVVDEYYQEGGGFLTSNSKIIYYEKI